MGREAGGAEDWTADCTGRVSSAVWAPLDVVKSTDTQALLCGAIEQSTHTATGASLARYLQDRFVTDDDIHLDLTVSIGR